MHDNGRLFPPFAYLFLDVCCDNPRKWPPAGPWLETSCKFQAMELQVWRPLLLPCPVFLSARLCLPTQRNNPPKQLGLHFRCTAWLTEGEESGGGGLTRSRRHVCCYLQDLSGFRFRRGGCCCSRCFKVCLCLLCTLTYEDLLCLYKPSQKLTNPARETRPTGGLGAGWWGDGWQVTRRYLQRPQCLQASSTLHPRQGISEIKWGMGAAFLM